MDKNYVYFAQEFNRERYINEKLIEIGAYDKEDRVSAKDYPDDNLIKIDGRYVLQKKELSQEDELFLKLKTIDLLEENIQNNKKIIKQQEEQKESIRIIKSILIFFTVITVLNVIRIIGSFLVMLNAW